MTPEEVCHTERGRADSQEEAARVKKEEAEARKAEKAEKKA